MNKTLLLALAGTLLIGATVFLATRQAHSGLKNEGISNETVAQLWKKFKKTYNKKFSDMENETYRMEVFASNLEIIENDKTGTLGITQFADISQQEFAETYLTLRVPETEKAAAHVSCAADSEVNVNWVSEGKVTAVKNQGRCGSCWAFSTTGSLESALILNGAEQTISLSEQQLVDCSFANFGCNGGWMDKAFQYIINNGITTEANYPYKASQGWCKFPKNDLSHEVSFTDVAAGCVSDLKAAVAQQPVSIAVDATNWSLYTGGVFSDCAESLNHGVLLAGFDGEAWLVKNSWGTNWGEAGYIRLAAGNTCGLANAASYPSV